MRRASSPLLALVALAALTQPARSEEPREIQATAHKVLDERYQTELPSAPAGSAPTEKAPAKSSSGSARTEQSSPQVSEPAQAVARLLLWCLLFAGALVAVLAIARVITRRKEVASVVEAQANAEEGASSGQPVVPLIEDVESLARAERYGEAIHALLGSVLEHFARLGNVTIGPSTTSREVLDAAPLDAPARAALGDLVSTVEVSLFGGLEVDEDDYSRCMSSFRRLEVVLSR